MGVKNSKGYDDNTSSTTNNNNNNSNNMGFNNQYLNTSYLHHLTPNDYLAYQQNSRFAMAMPQQALNMNSQLTHNSIRQPLSNASMAGSLSASNRLSPLDEQNTSLDATSDLKARDSPINQTEAKSINLSRHRSDAYKKKFLPTKSSLLQELLECPICMNLFENPHVLPCQHTFCKNCLVSLQKTDSTGINKVIDCPMCREKHRLPNGVDGLSANYTMKRLIELESMAAAASEKEKNYKDKAKCFVCQKFSYLQVCNDCSYMLCINCLEDPNHDIIIESKIMSRKQKLANSQQNNYYPPERTPSKYKNPSHDFVERTPHIQQYADVKYQNEKLKLTLLVHSSAIEINSDQDEYYNDEYGVCKTFLNVSVSINDRLITVKKMVENTYGISCKDQIIVFKDKILKNDLKHIHAYQIKQFSRIHVFDSRDIKENSDELNYDLYGIYQDADNVAIEQQQSNVPTFHQPPVQLHHKESKKMLNRHKSVSKEYYEDTLNRKNSVKPRQEKNQHYDNESSSSETYSSNEDLRDKGFHRRTNYRTVSSVMTRKPVITSRHENYSNDNINEMRPIVGQVKNVKRGAAAPTKLNSHSFRQFRKLDELFNND